VSMMREEPRYDDTQDSILETPAERLGASRRLFLGLAGAGTGAAALSACAAGGGGGDDEGGGSGVSGGDGEVTDDIPFGVAGDAAVDVVIFNGGYGDQYAKDAGEKYAEMYPDADVKVSSTVNIQPDLQPRFIGGNPPDLFANSGAQSMNAGAPVGEGSVADVDVVMFNGGYGDQYAKDGGEKYAEMYPGADVKVSSTVNIEPDLQPRFIGGNPPDLFDSSGAQSMNAGALVGEGSVAEIDQL